MERWRESPKSRADGWREQLDWFRVIIIIVRVASFAFRFETEDQLRACIKYYERKTHPSSQIPAKRLEAQLGKDWRNLRGWEVERWFERLSMYLLEEPKRQKVLKALSKALALIEAKKL